MNTPLSSADLAALGQDAALCQRLIETSPVITAAIQRQVSERMHQQMATNVAFDGRQVEVDVEPAALENLFNRTCAQWRFLGETKPHFSVLSVAEWSPEHMTTPERLVEFYNTGVTEANEFLQLCTRNNIAIPSSGRCVELGCGVGRVTVHLAKLFAEVTGLDISPGNLAEAEKAFGWFSIANARTRHIAAPHEFDTLGRFDVFFSRMVLQHNPPPVQAYVLDAMLKQLAPGGIAFFQTITGGPGYRYSVAAHLAHQKLDDFELHALPMGHVLRRIREHGCELRDVYRDLAGGFNVESYTFLVTKPGIPHTQEATT